MCEGAGDMPSTSEDEGLISPPGPMRVARRALVQSAVVCRGSLELDASDPDVGETFDRLRAWLEQMALAAEMEPIEAQILSAPLGSLNRRQAINASWAAEGLAVLAWALRRSDLPRHDVQVDPFDLTASLGFLEEDARALVDRAELRSIDELRACREVLYAIHSRYAQRRRTRRRIDFTRWIEPEWLALLYIDRSTFLACGDLAVDGEAIEDADDSLVRVGEWIAQRRHQASIWLVGESPIYTETPADI
jgi:hypothetical protein